MCRVLDMPPLGTVTNREAVIFDGAPPVVAEGPNVEINRRPTVLEKRAGAAASG